MTNHLKLLRTLSNSSLILDNENPVIIDSIPSNQEYLDSEQDREISLLIGDVSGFNIENEYANLGPRHG